ncbi:Elongator complex protein 6 [Dillenia turbinata]|uniref:Elongator complex protein 6 n=1 Tax=Dillenia turbinata TaxID=194707 RepID=A0AAN8VKD3_9MAGN
MNQTRNLLDDALDLNNNNNGGQVVVIEDCIETSGALGCNLAMQRESERFHFLDMLSMHCPDEEEEKLCEGGLVSLYEKIQKAVEVSSSTEGNKNSVTIMIDDISLVEVAANVSSNHVSDFLHYCLTLTSDFGCTLVILSHEDVYSSMEKPMLILQMEYLADVLIKTEPLAIGLASDIHGQVSLLIYFLTVVNRGRYEKRSLKTKTSNFQFKIRDNNVECFYPGSQT